MVPISRSHIFASIPVLAGLCLCCAQSETVNGESPSLSEVVELDHLYVYAPSRSTEGEVVLALEEAGINVSDHRQEFPDGIVGRYVLFNNAYIEMLWYDGNPDADVDTRRQAAWEITGMSPFGVGLRHIGEAQAGFPVPTRTYTTEWMTPGTTMLLLGSESDTLAPAMFVVPDYMAHPDSLALHSDDSDLSPDERAQEIEDRTHPLGVGEINRVRLVVPVHGDSEAARQLSQSGIVQVEIGTRHLLEIELGGGASNELLDLRPVLPLLIRY